MSISVNHSQTVRVLKFGGSSVGDPDTIRRVISVITEKARSHRLVVVVSALARVTNTLEDIVKERNTDRSGLLLALYRRHVETAQELLSRSELRAYRVALGRQFSAIIPALRRLRHRTHTRFDQESVLAAGERFSVPLIAAALRDAGLTSDAVDGSTLVRVADGGDYAVDLQQTNDQIRSWYDSVPFGTVPIVTGYIGSAGCGHTVTLGRGGSDFTASLIASSLKAELMERWTDVDGLFTRDPNRHDDATRYQVLQMDEAETLNRADQLGMHRHTLIPLIAASVPLRVRSINSFDPGTLVVPKSNHRTTAVSSPRATSNSK